MLLQVFVFQHIQYGQTGGTGNRIATKGIKIFHDVDYFIQSFVKAATDDLPKLLVYPNPNNSHDNVLTPT